MPVTMTASSPTRLVSRPRAPRLTSWLAPPISSPTVTASRPIPLTASAARRARILATPRFPAASWCWTARAGTYMQLPAKSFQQRQRHSVDDRILGHFWRESRTMSIRSRFGYTNFVTGAGCGRHQLCRFTRRTARPARRSRRPPSDPLVSRNPFHATGNLDGKTVHVACVIDPPNKMLAIYTNGVLEAVNTNFTVNIANINDHLSFIGRSLLSRIPT